MATHSSILAQRILWTEEPGGLLSMESQSQTQLKQLSMHACIGEGNGNPLQYSCLENSRDEGAWWGAIYGVAQSWTRLKRLSNSSSSNAIMKSKRCHSYVVGEPEVRIVVSMPELQFCYLSAISGSQFFTLKKEIRSESVIQRCNEDKIIQVMLYPSTQSHLL